MDDLGFNKVAGAVLAVALGMLVLTKLPGIVMGSEGEEIAYKVGSIDTGGGGEAPVDLPFPQADWVAAMDDTQGAKVFKKCKSCHNNEAGGANGTGPNLYGVVDNDVATHPGFKYSAAMLAMPGNWTYEELDDFLKKPSAHTPGTKMLFVGLKKPTDRAAVIEHLRLADTSVSPRPEAQPAVAEGEEDGSETTMEAGAEENGAGAEETAPANEAAQEDTTTENSGEENETAAEKPATEGEATATDAEDATMESTDTAMEEAKDMATDAKDGAMETATDMKDAAEKMVKPDEDPTE